MDGKTENTLKPKMRGVIHAFAFICTLVSTIAFSIYSFLRQFDLGIFIYLLSQLLQFGVSSCYHIVSWKPRLKRLLRHLDHMCIFILISGTQTSIVLNTPQIRIQSGAFFMLSISWIISLIGILKIIILNKLHNIFDLAVYIAHGAIVLPFYKLLSQCLFIDKVLMGLGGLFYVIGGLIYGFEGPNPFPYFFGYHEIFHVFTIIANICFGIVIVKNYLLDFIGIK